MFGCIKNFTYLCDMNDFYKYPRTFHNNTKRKLCKKYWVTYKKDYARLFQV